MDAILKRRSIRKFKEQEVSDEQVKAILQAGMSAPSAGNAQPWQFIVFRDKITMEAVTGFHPYAKMLPQASVAIMVCGDLSLEKFAGFWVQDCSAAIQNMLLEITDHGLGAVWLGLYPLEDRVKGAQELFGIPNNVIPLAMIPIGYPDEEKEPIDRFLPDRVHEERW